MNHILKSILSICLSALVIFTGIKTDLSNQIDKLILLEKRHENLVNLLPQSTGTANVLTASIDKDNPNLLVNSCGTYQSDDGYSVTVSTEGAITLQGSFPNGAWIGITPYGFNLPSGTYIYSDGGASVDGQVFMRQYGYNCGVSGQTFYSDVINLPTTNTFTWDATQYDTLAFDIVVAAGFTTDGTTFYPMVRKADLTDDTYYPCECTGIGYYDDTTTVKYRKYNLPRTALDKLNTSDWRIFANQIRFNGTSMASWSAIDFSDGTGIEFVDNDIRKARYGKINHTGMIKGSATDINLLQGTEEISSSNITQNKPLHEITDFGTYLQALDNPDYTVLISVKDEGTAALSADNVKALRKLGATVDFTNHGSFYRASYYAVLNPGGRSVNYVGRGLISYGHKLADGTDFNIKTLGLDANGQSYSSIVVGGNEYSMMRRGMNIVVYNNSTHKVEDTVCFDTCSGLTCFRPHDNP